MPCVNMEKTDENGYSWAKGRARRSEKRRGLSRVYVLRWACVRVAGTTLQGCRVSVATLSHRTACQASLSSYTHATPVTTIYLTSVDGHSNEPPRYDSPFLSSRRSSSSSKSLSLSLSLRPSSFHSGDARCACKFGNDSFNPGLRLGGTGWPAS